MGALTESMTRLRDEILVLRHNRDTFRAELQRSTKEAQVRVSALRRMIAHDLAGARRAWCGFVAGSQATRSQTVRRAHEVVLQPTVEHRHEARIPLPLVEARPSTEKSPFKKHRKH